MGEALDRICPWAKLSLWACESQESNYLFPKCNSETGMGCQLGTFLFKKEKMKRKCSQRSQEIVQPSGTNIVWFQGLEINPCLFPQVMSHGAQLYVLGSQNYPSSFLLFFPFFSFLVWKLHTLSSEEFYQPVSCM